MGDSHKVHNGARMRLIHSCYIEASMSADSNSQFTASRDTVESLWLQQIRGGDDAAWQHLIDQYEGRLLAFATARVNDRAIGEDIVQEVFVGFYRSLPNFDGSRSIEAYLYQICSYKITDYLRRSGKRKLLSLDNSSSMHQSSGVRNRTRCAAPPSFFDHA